MISSIPQKQPPASIAVSNVVWQPGFSPGGGIAHAFASASFAAGADLPWNSGRYSPYPSASSFSTGMNRRDAELMQYRTPVGAGPSSNTWPRCESPAFERTSVRIMPWEMSDLLMTREPSTGFVKLGQPVPESNLSREVKSGSPVATSTYNPAFLLSQYSL